MSRTIEQQRAAFALGFVKDYEGEKATKGTLAKHIQKTPIRILQNGFGQALAFLLSDNAGKKGEKREPSGKIYDCLEKWLCADGQPCRVYTANPADLMKNLVDGSRGNYLRAQAEALALFIWLKKFSDAYLDKEDA